MIREYGEEDDVEIEFDAGVQRWVIWASAECRHAYTKVDLLDVINYVKDNHPGLL